MKTMKYIATIVVMAVLLCSTVGCTSMPKLVRALKDDPASVKFDVVSYGTTVHFERSMPTNWVSPYSQPKIVRP